VIGDRGILSRVAKKKTLRQRALGLLPRTWALRLQLRAVDRFYSPRVAKAGGEEEDRLIGQHMVERGFIEEELAGIETRRLCRTARRYNVLVPEMRWSKNNRDEHWERGQYEGTLYLRRAAVAELRRQIEDAKKRRLELWQARATIISGLVTGLVALGSVIVSLVLAWRR
jgi:hypothetical protein